MSATCIRAATLAIGLAVASFAAPAATQLVGCAGGSFGASCGLDELIAGGSFTVDGYRFADFTLSLNSGQLLGASSIRVDTFSGAGGIGFTFVDTAGTLRESNGGLTSNNLSFGVTALAGSGGIVGATMSADLGAISGTGSYVQAFADIFDPSLTSYYANLTTSCDSTACGGTRSTASATFASASALTFVGGVDVSAASAGTAQLNGLAVTLVGAVPEPAEWALVAAGLVLIAGVIGPARRRRTGHAPR